METFIEPRTVHPDDFWGVGHLKNVLDFPGYKRPESPQELLDTIAQWKSEGRDIEIAYMGQGRVGWDYGHYAVIGCREFGLIEGTVFVLTAFVHEDCAAFAQKHGIKLFN